MMYIRRPHAAYYAQDRIVRQSPFPHPFLRMGIRIRRRGREVAGRESHRRLPQGDYIHVGRHRVEQSQHQGRRALLRLLLRRGGWRRRRREGGGGAEAFDNDADRAQVRARLVPIPRAGGVRRDVPAGVGGHGDGRRGRARTRHEGRHPPRERHGGEQRDRDEAADRGDREAVPRQEGAVPHRRCVA